MLDLFSDLHCALASVKRLLIRAGDCQPAPAVSQGKSLTGPGTNIPRYVDSAGEINDTDPLPDLLTDVGAPTKTSLPQPGPSTMPQTISRFEPWRANTGIRSSPWHEIIQTRYLTLVR